MAGPPIVLIAGASRPYPGEVANGDAWTVQRHGPVWRIALIDGLGHGPAAAAAAQAAVRVLDAQPELDPIAALAACHAALVGTRGAAMAVATIEPAVERLVFAGIGNVEGRLWRRAGVKRPISYRGIVGASMPPIRAFELALGEGWVFAMHSDGVSTRFPDDLMTTAEDPSAVAQSILDAWSRPADDATVVIALPA